MRNVIREYMSASKVTGSDLRDRKSFAADALEEKFWNRSLLAWLARGFDPLNGTIALDVDRRRLGHGFEFGAGADSDESLSDSESVYGPHSSRSGFPLLACEGCTRSLSSVFVLKSI